MTKYLGRRALYNFLIEKGYEVPKLKNMEYGKYHGDEWLKCGEIDVFCVRCKFIYVSVFEYIEERDFYFETGRYCYLLKDNKFELGYSRIFKKNKGSYTKDEKDEK